MKKHLKLKITGKVQGVWYRVSTQKMAQQHNISGFVKNMEDGSVYAELEGDPLDLKLLVDWCWKGPEHAKVHQVFVQEGVLANFSSFEIQN